MRLHEIIIYCLSIIAFNYFVGDWVISTVVANFIFSILHFVIIIKASTEVNKQKIRENFFIILLLWIIIVKLLYTYYNFVISILILGIILILTFRFRHLNSISNFLKFYLVICSCIIFIPNQEIFEYRLGDRIIWPEKISWDNFKMISPKDEPRLDAAIFSDFAVQVNRAYNYPPALLATVFHENKSWRKSTNINSQILLNHEEGHYNISEIIKRELLDSIKGSWGKNYNKIMDVVEHFNIVELKYQNLYDSVTDHGTIYKKQVQMEKEIIKKLKK